MYVYKALVIGNALTEIITFKTKPETITIEKDKEGKMRKARGYRGYITIKIKHGGLKRTLRKTMALAQHIEIGRSRGIGLSEIAILPKPSNRPPMELKRRIIIIIPTITISKHKTFISLNRNKR